MLTSLVFSLAYACAYVPVETSPKTVPLNLRAWRAEIPILYHKNSDLARLKEKAYLSVDFVYPLRERI